MFFKQKLTSLSDEELLLRYKESGDKAYVGELFKRYTHIVFLTCMKYLKDELESEDVAMQIFEKLLHDLPRYEVKNFKYWLHTVVRNQCLLELAKKKRAKKKIEEWKYKEQPGEAETPEVMGMNGVEKREWELNQLEEALKQLGPEQRRCLELFYLQQKSYKEVAELTGYSLKQVKSYIQNGKRNLKKHLLQLQTNE
ncbi:MAG: sigma-70 family RNA polymerase sigma factor [Bacteroidetes bacterium]|nr:MAG: sigma-70 family RNA polymerase sigma factor [Bacteroidota bacterium]